MACLDTCILIDLLRGAESTRKRRASAKILELAAKDERLTTTRFNVAELLVGAYRADDSSREIAAIGKLLARIAILDFDAEAANLFGRLTALLQEKGKPAGDMDVLIAATALVAGEKLVTDNEVHFRHITGLIVDTY